MKSIKREPHQNKNLKVEKKIFSFVPRKRQIRTIHNVSKTMQFVKKKEEKMKHKDKINDSDMK